MRTDTQLARGSSAPKCAREFVLYVEGPSDRDLLQLWARRASPPLVRPLGDCIVILGGRQPARAKEHFLSLGGASAGIEGLCVLDRDEPQADEAVGDSATPGFEIFTWPRRHIESYLLVPEAIRRSLKNRRLGSSLDALLRAHGAFHDSETGELDAKRLLSPNGPLARELGERVSPGRIAKAMRTSELHADVRGLLGRVELALGLGASIPDVIARR